MDEEKGGAAEECFRGSVGACRKGRHSYDLPMTHTGPPRADLPAAARTSVGALLLNGALFPGGQPGALFCTALGRALPFPEISVVGTKFRYLATHKDKYDVLFVGSSRFFHQIIPKQFDQAVTEATGQKLRSFNISCDALWPPESYYYLRKILALRSPRLRWVVIELMDLNPRIVDLEKPTKREAYWHDWTHTVLAWKTVQGSRRFNETTKRDLYLAHGRLLAAYWLNMGRGSEILETLMVPPKESPLLKEGWLETEGFRAEPNQGISAADLPAYTAAVKRSAGDEPTRAHEPPLPRRRTKDRGGNAGDACRADLRHRADLEFKGELPAAARRSATSDLQ